MSLNRCPKHGAYQKNCADCKALNRSRQKGNYWFRKTGDKTHYTKCKDKSCKTCYPK